MQRSSFSWSSIPSSAGMYGWVASNGNRKAEVVRCYPGQWTMFAYVDGKMQGAAATGQTAAYESYGAAFARASRFLRGAQS